MNMNSSSDYLMRIRYCIGKMEQSWKLENKREITFSQEKREAEVSFRFDLHLIALLSGRHHLNIKKIDL